MGEMTKMTPSIVPPCNGTHAQIKCGNHQITEGCGQRVEGELGGYSKMSSNVPEKSLVMSQMALIMSQDL